MNKEERRKALYEYLIKQEIPVSIEEVLTALPEYNLAKASSHDPCPVICSDIHAINNSAEFEKIIVIDHFTYYVPTKYEADQYLDTLWNAIEARLKRFYRIKYKLTKDSQSKFDENDEIKFIESIKHEIYTDAGNE